jgi:hypothetical protein
MEVRLNFHGTPNSDRMFMIKLKSRIRRDSIDIISENHQELLSIAEILPRNPENLEKWKSIKEKCAVR